MKAKVSFLGAGLLFASQIYAAISTSARIGGGPGRYRGPQQDVATSTYSGTLRLAYEVEGWGFLGGFDASTFRLLKSPRAGISKNIEGDQLGIFLGASLDAWNFWVGGGAGQIRVYDREEPDPNDPYRFLAREQELGLSLAFYRALYGKIDGCLIWRRYMPEKKWREKYELAFVDAWQFELGLKLLTW